MDYQPDKDNAEIVFGNDKISLVCNRDTGCIELVRRASSRENVFSCVLRMGLRVKNVSDGTEQTFQLCDCRKDVEHQIVSKSNCTQLILNYGNVYSYGIKIRVLLSINDDEGFLRSKLEVQNSEKCEICDLFLGVSSFGFDVQETVMTLPDIYFGKFKKLSEINLNHLVCGETVYCYPGQGDGLSAAWVDFSCGGQGIAIACLDKQELPIKLSLSQDNEDMNVRWHYFDLTKTKLGGDTAGPENTTTFEPDENYTGIFAMEPGCSFSTDEFLIIPHSDDWHEVADIYRSEYEKVFKGNYLGWNQTSGLAKNIDVFLHYIMLGRDGKLVKRFDQVLSDVKQVTGKIGANPENVMVWIAGQGSCGHDNRNPDFFPPHPSTGGMEGLLLMMKQLKDFGIKGVMFYLHPYANHPEANFYVPQADMGRTFNWAGVKLGNQACVDCSQWLDMWREKICPYVAEAEATGVQLDQSPQSFMVCDRSDHLHGSDHVSAMAANSKGMQKIVEVMRQNCGCPDLFVMSEFGNDLLTRNMDIWQYHNLNNVNVEVLRFTFPYRLTLSYGDTNTVDGLNQRLINGTIMGVYADVGKATNWFGDNIQENDTSGWQISDELLEIYSQAVRIRRELREKKAPGFPYGFRHDVGVKVTDPNLVVRVYKNDEGVTLLYYAKKTVNTKISLDEQIFNQLSLRKVDVSLLEGEAAYKIIHF